MLGYLTQNRRGLTITMSGVGGALVGYFILSLWALSIGFDLSSKNMLSVSHIVGFTTVISALCASSATVAFFLGTYEKEQTIKRSSLIDPLTDLFSKSGIIELVEKNLNGGGSPKARAFLINLEIDRFKEFNDLHGNLAGDELIRQVARRLEKLTGAIGHLGRFGGGEFGLILETNPAEVEIHAVCDHLIDILCSTYTICGIVSAMTCSLGVSEIKPGGSVSHTVRGAHMALQQTRMTGRGCWSIFTEDMHIREDYRLWIESQMRDALKRNEFHLYYQPQFNILTNKITGFEALLRWKHPQRGYIPPSDFIKIAEETGFINQLGRWVMMKACRDALEFESDVLVAVNISPVQFLNGDFVKIVSNSLSRSGLPASRLELEVTESTLIEDRARTAKIFEDISNLGVSLAIDDFGTGYSNLGYLADLPFKKLKIDKSFIERIDQDAHIGQIISAIIALAHALGAVAVAEGVERKEQEILLRAAGCTVVQGFLHGKPVPFEQARKLIDTESVIKNLFDIKSKSRMSLDLNQIVA
jgi:diguanylate cyclase (GGDEF)-like protein